MTMGPYWLPVLRLMRRVALLRSRKRVGTAALLQEQRLRMQTQRLRLRAAPWAWRGALHAALWPAQR